MQQIAKNWIALSPSKQVAVVAAAVAMLTAVFVVFRMASQPSMALLYSGLESGPAGDVVQALEQRGVAFDVRGGSIFVPHQQRDELRMTLASEGMPANGSKGYELLDSLTGFGTTSQMFDAAYWRAKEGELARTILANPQIRSARVHIANASSNPFQRDLRPSASISVTTVGGAELGAGQAKAFKFLVASAVAGLDPNDVAVIDGNGGLVTSAADDAPVLAGADRAQKLREQVLRLLEARVGYGNAVVEVAVDTVTETESIRERLVDPESRVAISTDTEERSNTSSDAGGGDVTVASNLPDGDAAGGGSNSQNSETRERVNYEVSQTEREIVRAPGAVRKLSVAVLVNGTPVTDAQGQTTIEPLPDAEIEALRELVSSAVGLDAERGDTLTIKSMPFTPIGTEGTPAGTGLMDGMSLDIMSLIQMAVAGLVALILGLFVVRPILTSGANTDSVPALAGPVSDVNGAPEALGANTLALDGEIDDGSGGFAPVASPSLFEEDVAPPEDPVERLRTLISERQEETVEVLRGWLDEKGEKV